MAVGCGLQEDRTWPWGLPSASRLGPVLSWDLCVSAALVPTLGGYSAFNIEDFYAQVFPLAYGEFPMFRGQQDDEGPGLGTRP